MILQGNFMYPKVRNTEMSQENTNIMKKILSIYYLYLSHSLFIKNF